MTDDDAPADLETLLRRVIREESGLTEVVPAEKWRDGELVLRPGKPGLQEKTWPIETFFHKVVMLRNRLRTLEQQVNGSDLPDHQKVKLQTLHHRLLRIADELQHPLRRGGRPLPGRRRQVEITARGGRLLRGGVSSKA